MNSSFLFFLGIFTAFHFRSDVYLPFTRFFCNFHFYYIFLFILGICSRHCNTIAYWTVCCRSSCWKSIGCLFSFKVHKCESDVYTCAEMALHPFEYQSKIQLWLHCWWRPNFLACMCPVKPLRDWECRSEWTFRAINWNDIPSWEVFNLNAFDARHLRFSICHSTNTKSVKLKNRIQSRK